MLYPWASERGPLPPLDFEIFSKKGYFLSFEREKTNFVIATFGPPWNILNKSTNAPPGKNPSEAHGCICRVRWPSAYTTSPFAGNNWRSLPHMLTVHWFPWGRMQTIRLQALISDCCVRTMISTKHHIPSTDKAEVHNVVIPNVRVDKNVIGPTCLAVALVGRCECGNNYFDLRQQQDLAQELGDGDYDVHNHSAYEHYKNEVARTLIRQYRPCHCQSKHMCSVVEVATLFLCGAGWNYAC